MNFETSSHCQRWLFTPEKLASVRAERHKRVAQALAKVQEEAQVQQPGALQSNGQPGKKGKKLRPPSLADEAALLKYYKGRVQELCRAFGFPAKVQAAAITFLSRFYLRRSPLEHDVKDTMLACLYLAGKVEEAYIGAEEMCKRLQQQEETLLNLEPQVLQGLGFDLITYSPHSALAGFFMDLKAMTEAQGVMGSPAAQGVTEQQMADAKKAARAAADALMLTDAPLLFPPGQLALAAMRSGFNKVKANFTGALGEIARKAGLASAAPEDDVCGKLRAAISSIDTFGAEGSQPVSAEEARKVDRRVKACQGLLSKATAEKPVSPHARQETQSQKDVNGASKAEPPPPKRLKLDDIQSLRTSIGILM